MTIEDIRAVKELANRIGADKLREGSKVELITPEARDAAAQTTRGQKGDANGSRRDGGGRAKKGG